MIRLNKSAALCLIINLFVSFSGFSQTGFGRAEKINTDWLFHLGEIDGLTVGEKNNRSWQRVQLPHDWSVKQVFSPNAASASGYLPGGLGWYQKELTISKQEEGRKLYLYFEGVYNRSEVFINGHSLGKRPNGYVSFSYEITPFVKYGQKNLVAVKVDHTKDADSRWYTGSGIYRDVWLVSANAVHLEQWSLYAYPEIKGKTGVLHVQSVIKNESLTAGKLTARYELLDQNGSIVAKNTNELTLASAQSKEIKSDLLVNNPELWSTSHPTLYRLRVSVLQDNRIVDSATVVTGFRSLTFSPDKGFALNGQHTKVKGVCLHHDSGVLGAEVYPEVWRSRLLTLKSLGVNAIRTSHNPQAPSLYALCDELGLLVMNEAFDEWEFPKRKWLQGWNVGVPGFQGTSDFFKEWGEKDLEDMVKRDRNHISIFAWSIGNEVDYPNDPYSHPILAGTREGGFTQPIFGGYKKDAPDAMRLGDIAKKLAAVVRKYDGRPVTAGLAGVAMSNETAYPGALDIAGYNYTESRYLQDHQRYPNRVIFGSENRHDIDAWKAVKDNEYIFGQFLWTGIDYLGESGRWPSRGFYSGLVDFAGFIKPRGYFRQSLWSDQPMAYLGTYPLRGGGAATDTWSVLEAEQGQQKSRPPSMDAWPIWNYENGQSIRVVCYTNTKKARLELNGRVIGQVKPYNEEHGIIYWDVPFVNGKLEVIGMDLDGKEVVRHHIQSSKRPHAIKVVQGNQLQVNANGILQLELQVVDEDGVAVMLSDDEITCKVIGNAYLIGMEAGNNSDMGDYTDNKQRAFHGRMMIYLKTNGRSADEVFASFSSPWLKESIVEIKLR